MRFAIVFYKKIKKSCVVLLTKEKNYGIIRLKLHYATRKEVKKMINTNKLKGLMREKNITQADIAKCIGVAQATACQKLNNSRPMYVDEAEKICDLLGIDSGDFGIYFFANDVA